MTTFILIVFNENFQFHSYEVTSSCAEKVAPSILTYFLEY